MKQDVLEYCFGYRDQKYLRFVNRFLLLKSDKELSNPLALVDPFALDVPVDIWEDLYVARTTVEQELCDHSCKIFLGLSGSGKSTLFEWRKKTPEADVLTVPLSLLQMPSSLVYKDFSEGRTSILTPEVLAQAIFNCFWEQIVVSESNRDRFLPYWRHDQEWLHKLHYFYHHLPPSIYEIPSDIVLTSWLCTSNKVESFSPTVSHYDLLRYLVTFVTRPPRTRDTRFGTPPPNWPYKRIVVLVDGIATLSPPALMRLLADAQALYNMACERLELKIFAPLHCKEQLDSLECIRQGRFARYQLPEWKADELAKILQNRLNVWRDDVGLRLNTNLNEHWSWISDLPESCMDEVTKRRFSHLLIEGTQRCRQERQRNSEVEAAPVHLLRLMRGCVMLMAEREQRVDMRENLLTQKITGLCEEYWKRVTREE